MIPGSVNALLLGGEAAVGGYSISRSLRFNSADSAYLSRTPASAGNRRTYTWSGWVKRSALGSGTYYLLTAVDGANVDILGFEADNLYWNNAYSGAVTSTDKFRDPAAWYHIVFAIDSTQATDSNRVKMYVNGRQITAFNSSLWPSLNRDFAINNTVSHKVGQYFTTNSSDFYLADIHFIDGQALTPTSFGQFDTNGIWQPKAYSGTYGTNGFQLKFADNSAATATTLGKDTSGNGNNWTPNNLSVTAGSGNDSLVDSPTNGTASSGGDAGGTVVGNYATLNPLSIGYTSAQGLNSTIIDGNLQFSCTNGAGAAPHNNAVSTIAVSSGKWYAEFLCSALGSSWPWVGIVASSRNRLSTTEGYIGDLPDGYVYGGNGQKGNNNTLASYGASYTTGDLIGVALDLDSGTLTFYKNGTTQGTAYSGLSGTFLFVVANWSSGVWIANFGQRPFAYAAPSGFKSLNTANLPTPTILKGSDYFDTKLYTGNGSTQTISGLGFSPDFVWGKARSNAGDHTIVDSVRGDASGTTNKTLFPSYTDSEYSGLNRLYDFSASGFTAGGALNTNAVPYVAWCWDAGSSNSTNTQGSITSTVRANASAGFSVVTYTGNGTAGATIGHGLGVAPQMVIVKNRDSAQNWPVYHINLTSAAYYILLNSTGAQNNNVSCWNNTAPSSTLITLGGTGAGGVNESTQKCVAYCFAPVAGYSSFGSYVGNASATDGPFVYTGFRPKWILVKASNLAVSWQIYDSARNTYNLTDNDLYPDRSDSENAQGVSGGFDFLSNGFKVKSGDSWLNNNNTTYIYAAFSEVAFSIARAR